MKSAKEKREAPERQTLMQKYFSPLQHKLELTKPSPGPACVGERELSPPREVERSERRVFDYKSDTPPPVLNHSSLERKSVRIAASDRWTKESNLDKRPSPNAYSPINNFKYTRAQSPIVEFNTSERFEIKHTEKRPDYYFNAKIEKELPAVRINKSQRNTDGWMM